MILEKYDEAKEHALDIRAVYIALAEDIGVTVGAMQQHASTLVRKRKKIQGQVQESLLEKVQRVITERDCYKEKYEALLAEHKELERML